MMDSSRKSRSPLAGASKNDASDLKFGDCIASSLSKSERGFVDMDSVAPAIETRETRAARSGVKPRSAAACEPRSGEPWENTNNATPPEKSRRAADLRARSYERRGSSRAMMIRWHGGERKGFDPLSLPRCAKCGMSVKSAVGISTNGKRSAFSGVMRCGSIWACPVCSGIIRTARADEVSKMVERNASGALVFGTLTVRHHAGMPLQMLLDAVMAGWQKMVTGTP